MALQSFDVTITDNGEERHFKVKEMPATTGFIFGVKVMKFICNNNADLKGGEDITTLFVKAIGGINIDEFKSIMDEALSYVYYVDGVSPRSCNGNALDSILNDPANVLKLLQQSLEVNLSFIKRAIPADFQKKINGAMNQAGLSPKTLKKVMKPSAS